MGRKPPTGWKEVSKSDLSQFEIAKPQGHAVERYEAVRNLFAAICALRAIEALPPGNVTIRGAEFQKARGSLAAGTQAAHVLPRQLLISGRSLDDWLSGSKLPDIEFIRLGTTSNEGTVTTLPTTVNQADSVWERAGLAEAFRAAAQAVVHRKPGSLPEADLALMGAWRSFHTEAGQALRRATSEADEKLHPILQSYVLVHVDQASNWGQDRIGMMWTMIVGG